MASWRFSPRFGAGFDPVYSRPLQVQPPTGSCDYSYLWGFTCLTLPVAGTGWRPGRRTVHFRPHRSTFTTQPRIGEPAPAFVPIGRGSTSTRQRLGNLSRAASDRPPWAATPWLLDHRGEILSGGMWVEERRRSLGSSAKIDPSDEDPPVGDEDHPCTPDAATSGIVGGTAEPALPSLSTKVEALH